MKKLILILLMLPIIGIGQITIENTVNSIKVTESSNVVYSEHKSQAAFEIVGAMVYFKTGGSSIYKARYSEIDAPVTANISDLNDTLNLWIGKPVISIIQDSDGDEIDISDSGKLKTNIYDTAGYPASVDRASNTLQNISNTHSKLHSGNHYTCSDFTTLNDTDTLDYLITTADSTQWAHMLFFFGGVLDTDIEIFETTTHTASTALNCINNNRNSANTALVAVNLSNEDGADGDLIFKTGFGTDAGFGANRITAGGTTRGDSEFILKQDTKYLLRIMSHSDSNKVSLILEWYENISKN